MTVTPILPTTPDVWVQSIDNLLPLVAPHAIGASDIAIAQALRMAAGEWCEKTRCWRHEEEIFVYAQDDPLPAPGRAVPFQIDRVHLLEDDAHSRVQCELRPMIYDDMRLHDLEPHRLGPNSDGRLPMYFSQQNPGGIAIAPFRPSRLLVGVFLKPGIGQAFGPDLRNEYDVLPPWLLNRDGDRIASGALSRILMDKKIAGYDPEMAGMHRNYFQEGINSGAVGAFRGEQNAVMRIRPFFM